MQPYTTQTDYTTALTQYHAPRLTMYVWRDPFQRLFVEIHGYDNGPIEHNPLVSFCASHTNSKVKNKIELLMILKALGGVDLYHDDVAKLTILVTEHYADKETGE